MSLIQSLKSNSNLEFQESSQESIQTTPENYLESTSNKIVECIEKNDIEECKSILKKDYFLRKNNIETEWNILLHKITLENSRICLFEYLFHKCDYEFIKFLVELHPEFLFLEKIKKVIKLIDRSNLIISENKNETSIELTNKEIIHIKKNEYLNDLFEPLVGPEEINSLLICKLLYQKNSDLAGKFHIYIYPGHCFVSIEDGISSKIKSAGLYPKSLNLDIEEINSKIKNKYIFNSFFTGVEGDVKDEELSLPNEEELRKKNQIIHLSFFINKKTYQKTSNFLDEHLNQSKKRSYDAIYNNCVKFTTDCYKTCINQNNHFLDFLSKEEQEELSSRASIKRGLEYAAQSYAYYDSKKMVTPIYLGIGASLVTATLGTGYFIYKVASKLLKSTPS